LIPSEVSAIILAGGQSSRMGKNKAELTINGITLLEIQAKKCRAIGIDDVIIAGYKGSIPGTRTVPDIIPGKGPLSGIHAGLAASEKKACLVLSVDTPLICPMTLKELIKAHSGGTTMLDNSGKPEPMISVFDSSLAEKAGEILQSEKTSVMRLADTAGVKPFAYNGDKELLSNCNTPEDFERVLKIAGQMFKEMREIKTFFGRKNSVRLVEINGWKAVKKVFDANDAFKREKKMYELLYGSLCTPEYFISDENKLHLSYIPGITFLELLERQEKENFTDTSLWQRLAELIVDVKRRTGLVNGDVNLRNYLYYEELDRIYLIDFEECGEWDIAEKAAELCAFILLYYPENTDFKKNISKVMQDKFCELLSIAPADMEKEVAEQAECIRERRTLKNKNK